MALLSPLSAFPTTAAPGDNGAVSITTSKIALAIKLNRGRARIGLAVYSEDSTWEPIGIYSLDFDSDDVNVKRFVLDVPIAPAYYHIWIDSGTASDITVWLREYTAPGAATDVKSKYLLAKSEKSHMHVGATTGLSALAGGSSQALADARYTALRASLIAHYAAAGASATVDGVHKAADASNGATMSATVDGTAATLITRIGEMLTSINAHATQSGVHFNNDPATVALVVGSPTTLAHCVSNLNGLLTAIETHYLLASF